MFRYFFGVGEDTKQQKQLLEKFISEVLVYNQRRGAERKHPATFKKCLSIAQVSSWVVSVGFGTQGAWSMYMGYVWYRIVQGHSMVWFGVAPYRLYSNSVHLYRSSSWIYSWS